MLEIIFYFDQLEGRLQGMGTVFVYGGSYDINEIVAHNTRSLEWSTSVIHIQSQ